MRVCYAYSIMKNKNTNTLTNNHITHNENRQDIAHSPSYITGVKKTDGASKNYKTDKPGKSKKSDKSEKSTKAINRIKSWHNYNEGLIERGQYIPLVLWAVREMEREMKRRSWTHHSSAGRPKKYPDTLILVIAVFREVYGFTLRDAVGFAKNAFENYQIEIPDYSTIERRMGKLHIDLKIDKRRLKGDLYIMADSTGYKIHGEGEWKTHKHGYSKKRSWTKAHYSVDWRSEQTVAITVTPEYCGDNLETPHLLEETKHNIGDKFKNVVAVLGDGAYNTRALKKTIEEDYDTKLISPPKKKRNSDGKEFCGANKADNERCNEVGRAQWKNEVGYHKRSLVETNMFRQKSPFGDKMKSRKPENQIVELKIRARIMNMWTNKWMPRYT